MKIESARKLASSEYTLNSQLGYISLKSKLNADEMIAVAYEYTYNGQVYQVGEFSGDVTDTDQCLFSENVEGFYHIDLITHLGFNDEKCLFAGGLSGSEG